jgi:hypothetical protein
LGRQSISSSAGNPLPPALKRSHQLDNHFYGSNLEHKKLMGKKAFLALCLPKPDARQVFNYL